MGEPRDVTKLEPGTVLLGKYRVVETLGIGGMGVVVAADHVALGNRVALKFLLPSLMSNESVAGRFVREAKAAIKIKSDHVATVLDVDTLPEGPPFMVMEYLEGEDLAFLVDSNRHFDVEEAVDLIVQAAEALAQAHRIGIVHRDVKPANLFLVERGDDPALVKVLDFGVSKIMDDQDWGEQAVLTKTTAVIGSGLYMSPEQMRSAKKVDRRTDIYALGVCLYELLAHTQPYTADSFAELCVKVSTEPPTPLRTLRPDVSEEFAQTVARAYASKPDDRYQSIAEMVMALGRYASEATQETIDAIVEIGEGRRSTMPSIPPQATVVEPVAGSQRPSTMEALSATAAAEPVRPSRVSLVVVLAAVLLAAIALAALFIGLRGSGETAAPAATATSSEASGDETTAPPPETSASSSEAPLDAAADPAEADAEAGAGGAQADPPSTATARPTPRPRPRPTPRPKPVGPCFGKDPESGLRVEIPCK